MNVIRSIYFIIFISIIVNISKADDTLLREIQPAQNKINMLDDFIKISTISVSPNGNKIITGATNLIVWDTQSGNKLIEYSGHGINTWIESSAISSSGDLVISGAIGYDAKIWNIQNGKELQSLKTSGTFNRELTGVYVSGVAFMYADQVAITANNTGVVQMWNVENGKEFKYYDNLNTIYSIELSPDQENLIIQLWSNFYLLNLDTR